VPRVERGEFVNVGIVLFSSALGVLQASIDLDEERLLALEPNVDLKAIHDALSTIPAICAGGAAAGAIGRLTPRERFDWLVAERSTCIQMSPVHAGLCADTASELTKLLDRMVRI
jgi:hypothetical protein